MQDEHNSKYYTKELIHKAQSGDEQALATLVKNNSALVNSLIKKYSYLKENTEDLYQIGVIGLIKAIKNFDFSYNTQFSTYAVYLINGELKRHFRDDGIIKVSRSVKSVYLAAKNERERFIKINGYEPGINDISKNIGCTPEQVSEAFEACRMPDYLSESVSGENGEGKSLEEYVPDDKNPLEDSLERIALKNAISSLPPKERQLIMLRYFSGMTQSKVAEILSMSQVSVSRLEKKIIERLREGMADK
ncbi:MAG: sigma-70 family RNA polymerase sigma factor [Anaerofustis stercorihominis]|nr:sigma-70 family RNA polymerase sigma factor [Anaerofustis stercorihominis]